MIGLIGAAVGAAAKFGYDQYKRNQNRSEKREYFDYVNASNYGYYIRSLEESPSAQREGLVRAGYNPMLALGHIGSSSYGGASVSSGDIETGGDLVSSAKEGGKLENDIRRSFDDTHEKTKAETDVLDADAKAREVQSENDTLRTLSQLENDAVERQVKESQILKNTAETTKTKVDTIAEPLSDAGKMGIGGGVTLGGAALMKFFKKYLPKVVPLFGSSAATLGSRLVPMASSVPLFLGSAGVSAAAAAGIKASQKGTGKKMVEQDVDKTKGKYNIQHGNWSR